MANDWVEISDDWKEAGDWEEVTTTPKRTLWQTTTTPISKLLTGKSIGERTDFLNKKGEQLLQQAIRENKTPSTAEFFIKQLPAATGQVLVNFFDLTPLDIGIVAATAGAGKIPLKGTTLGEIASKVPVGKGFFKGAKELGRYEQTLKTITPLSSRGVPTTTEIIPKLSIPTEGIVEAIPEGLEPFVERARQLPKEEFITKYNQGLKAQNLTTRDTAKNIDKLIKRSGFKDVEDFYDRAVKPTPTEGKVEIPQTRVSTGEEISKINLSKYTPETQEGIKKIISTNPELLNRKVVGHQDLDILAQQLETTPIVKKILSLPEGEMAAEILKLRQGEDAIIRSALSDDLVNLGTNLKKVLEVRQTQAVGRIGTETGRALEQFKMPIEQQQELANIILQKIQQIKKDPTFGGEESKRLIAGLVDLRKTVLSKDFNPTWLDKGYEFWLNNILSGPWTHTVNMTSNVLFGGVAKPIEKAVYAGWDTLISLGTKKRTQYFSEIPEQIKGFGMAFNPKQKLPTGIAGGSKIIEERIGKISGKLGEVIRLPTKGLVVEDNWAKRFTGFAEMMGRAEAIAKQEGLKGSALIARKNQLLLNPTEQLVNEVNKEQLIRTFQNTTGLSEFLKLIPRKGFRWVLPFKQTVSSILTQAFERTPAGLIKIGIKGVKSLKGIPYPQSEIATDLGNTTIGISLLAGIMYGLKKGNIVGSVPREKAKRDVFYAQGKQPYSILLGDKYVPFGRLEPFGTAMMYMTDFLQGYSESDKEVPVSKLIDATGKISYSLANKTFLSGMTYLVQAVSDPQRYAEDFLTRTLSGFVPASGLMRNIKQMKDLGVRETEGIIQGVQAQVPLVSEKLPPRISSFGEEVKRKPVGVTRYLPFPVTRVENNVVANELSRLDIALGYPDKKFKGFRGENIKLTPQEYNQFLIKKGGATVRNVGNLISSPTYSKLPQEVQTKMVKNIITSTGEAVRNNIKLQKFVTNNDWVEVQ